MSEPLPTQLIEMEINNSPSTLPRLLLAFSRRRLRITELAMLDDDSGATARLRIGFQAATDRVDGFLRQVERMVEVSEVDWLGQTARSQLQRGAV